ncbi:aliphatic sulfonate ABC transporter substrate-binding protein (plasmid) [Deltaproteobacteria bacterium Smac51]|nr:aliphatic sulfonate ABC transporter substrate-binding protein [Deltaproteobacteria bacterium Smac51]
MFKQRPQKVVLFLCLVLFCLSSAAASAEEAVRMGFQKSSTLMILIKNRGSLEKALAPLGVEVQWHQFVSGMPMMEAARAGQLDVTADVADTITPFALSSNAPLTFFLQERPSPEAQALLALNDSPVKTVADLKGKNICLTKGAGGHYLVMAELEKAGLDYNKDVKIAYMAATDCRAAFMTGAVAAWSAYDPFLSATMAQGVARVISDGRRAGADYHRFYLTASDYAAKRPDVLKVIFDELKETGDWVKANPEEAAELIAPVLGFDLETVKMLNDHRSYDIDLVDQAAVDGQQKLVDAFALIEVLPERFNVSDKIKIWEGR